jgi:hypothetical protein
LIRFLLIPLIACLFLATTIVRADDEVPVEITPHLGYGIHFAPNTSVNPALVNQLNMDWVKIYDPGMAGLFPGKRVLYRLDLRWTNDWNGYRNSLYAAFQGIATLPIDAVEIGNEPNLINEWGYTPNAWEYVQVLRVAYTIAKQVKPSLIIVSAGLAPTITTGDRSAINDLEYAKEMFENGAGQWFDAFGYHPYGYNMPPEADPTEYELVFRRTERIRALMESYGIYKQVWLTEFGWLRDPAEDGVSCSDSDPNFRGFAWLRVSARQQADYLVRAFDYAHKNWQWAGPMFVWNLNWQQLSWLNPCDHVRWFSLLNLRGEPVPAFYALQSMPRYTSDYLPRLEVSPTHLAADVYMACLDRVPLGRITIHNMGYPVGNLRATIQPVSNPYTPPVEVTSETATVDEVIGIFADAREISSPGEYLVFINVRATVGDVPFSQSVQGTLRVYPGGDGC